MASRNLIWPKFYVKVACFLNVSQQVELSLSLFPSRNPLVRALLFECGAVKKTPRVTCECELPSRKGWRSLFLSFAFAQRSVDSPALKNSANIGEDCVKTNGKAFATQCRQVQKGTARVNE